MIILKYNVSVSNVLDIFSFFSLYFSDSLSLALDIFHQFGVENANSGTVVRFLKLPFFFPWETGHEYKTPLSPLSLKEKRRGTKAEKLIFLRICVCQDLFQIKKQSLFWHLLNPLLTTAPPTSPSM